MRPIQQSLEESIAIRTALLADQAFAENVGSAVATMVSAFKSGGKVLLCGNGGSAADAQHIAAELSGRFKMDRKPLFAEALHVNSSFLTAVANDYGYDQVFARMAEAMGKPGDVIIGLSTSGNSLNVAKALQKGRELGMHTIALLGKEDGSIGQWSDIALHVPSSDTARIQEVHITIGHVLCEQVETQLFGT